MLALAAPARADDGPATPRSPPALMPAADVADVELQGWWRAGDLLVGHPGMEGRPGLRPLADLRPVVLPPDLADWAEVGGSCVSRPESRARRGERELVARATASQEGPVIQVLDGPRVVAVNALGRPARVCEILLGEADAMPGLEVVVAWRMEAGPAARASAEEASAEGAAAEETTAAGAAAGASDADAPDADAPAVPATGEGGGAPELRGFTVYRLPEAAR